MIEVGLKFETLKPSPTKIGQETAYVYGQVDHLKPNRIEIPSHRLRLQKLQIRNITSYGGHEASNAEYCLQ